VLHPLSGSLWRLPAEFGGNKGTAFVWCALSGARRRI